MLTKVENTYLRNMNWQDYIISDKEVLLGKPTIKGTRIAVDHIISLLAQGWSEEKILANYPRLTSESLKAVFAYIYDCIQDGLLYTTFRKAS
jgi:uncharacterized protein (DUF433 family)